MAPRYSSAMLIARCGGLRERGIRQVKRIGCMWVTLDVLGGRGCVCVGGFDTVIFYGFSLGLFSTSDPAWLRG